MNYQPKLSRGNPNESRYFFDQQIQALFERLFNGETAAKKVIEKLGPFTEQEKADLLGSSTPEEQILFLERLTADRQRRTIEFLSERVARRRA